MKRVVIFFIFFLCTNSFAMDNAGVIAELDLQRIDKKGRIKYETRLDDTINKYDESGSSSIGISFSVPKGELIHVQFSNEHFEIFKKSFKKFFTWKQICEEEGTESINKTMFEIKPYIGFKKFTGESGVTKDASFKMIYNSGEYVLAIEDIKAGINEQMMIFDKNFTINNVKEVQEKLSPENIKKAKKNYIKQKEVYNSLK